jgi:hypothetical protein
MITGANELKPEFVWRAPVSEGRRSRVLMLQKKMASLARKRLSEVGSASA